MVHDHVVVLSIGCPLDPVARKKRFPAVPGDCLKGRGIGCPERRFRHLHPGEVVLPFFLGNPGGNGFDDPGHRRGIHIKRRTCGAKLLI